MKLKRILKTTALGLLVLLILVIGGMVIWSKTSTYPARETALDALNASESVGITQDEWIIFTPEKPSDTGLIFYPGGLVAPEAYAPVLRQIAERGILVIITPMPLNLAIFDTYAANAVIDSYPQITNWMLVGHSLGGAAAAIYAEKNPGKIDGLAFWDSYPPNSADLSDNNILVLSIYGTSDGIPNTDNFDAKRILLPEDATFIAIEGASHAQFGDYGPQRGDVTPSISAEEQHSLVAEAMLAFMPGSDLFINE